MKSSNIDLKLVRYFLGRAHGTRVELIEVRRRQIESGND